MNIRSCLFFSGAPLLLMSLPAVAEVTDLPSLPLQETESDQTPRSGNETSSASTAVLASEVTISHPEYISHLEYSSDSTLSATDSTVQAIPFSSSDSQNSSTPISSASEEHVIETPHGSGTQSSTQEEVVDQPNHSSLSDVSLEQDVNELSLNSSAQLNTNSSENLTSTLSNAPSSTASTLLPISTQAEDLGGTLQITASGHRDREVGNAIATSRVIQPRPSERLSKQFEVAPEMVNAIATSRVIHPRLSRSLSSVTEVMNVSASNSMEEMTTEEWLTLVINPPESLESASVHRSDDGTLTVNSNLEVLAQRELRDWERELLEGSMDQVTSVSQLSDVQPTDWSFQALQSLVEQYGIIAGYPDGTFRGDRPLTRYEFAATLNSVLDIIQQRIVDNPSGQTDIDTLETARRLQLDFATELATLRNRVDVLEARTTTLEAQQFSTTVQLSGQTIFGLATSGGGNPPGEGQDNVLFTYLSQLQLAGSLAGRDLLRVGLSAGNFGDRGFANPEALNTNMALLSYQSDTNNQLELDTLEYRFAVGDRLVAVLQPTGFDLGSVLDSNSPYADSGKGAISRFASESPIFKIGGLDAGVGFTYLLTNRLQLQMAYGIRNSNSNDIGIRNPNTDNGLFSSDHRAFGVQLFAQPAFNVRTGIAYINAFAEDGRLDTYTGSFNADTSGNFNEPSTIHAISGTLQWQATPNIVFGAWGGLTVTDSLPSDAAVLSTTYLFSLGFSDPFGREGDLLALMVGQSPRLRFGYNIEREDEGSGLHFEAFYRHRLNDNISITPGIFVVTDPGHIPDNNTIFVAALRTTIRF